MAWLPAASTTLDPARFAMNRCAGGGIILSSVATRYQLGLDFHAGWLIVPPAPFVGVHGIEVRVALDEGAELPRGEVQGAVIELIHLGPLAASRAAFMIWPYPSLSNGGQPVANWPSSLCFARISAVQ